MRIWLLILAATLCATADPARDAALREDLNFIAQKIVATHPNPFTRVTSQDFYGQVQALNDAIPTLTDAQVYARMIAVVAFIQDAHTSILMDDLLMRLMGLERFPLRATLYDDAFVVSSTFDSYTRYLGWRVITIDGKSPLELVQALSPFVSHDNEAWLRQAGAALLQYPQFLNAAGLTPVADRGVWVVESKTGQRETLTLRSVPLSTPGTAAVNDTNVGYLSPTFVDLNLFYWFRYYPEQKLLFFKYNSCAVRPDLPFNVFTDDMMQALDSQPVDSLVVDLRDNTGGDASIITPFFNALRARYVSLLSNPRFHFYGLISRLTASSAMQAAQIMKTFNGALLVGEDTGGNPDAFGNYVPFKLPNSGVELRVSTRYYPPLVAGVAAPSVHPDVRAYRDSSDVFARFDPVLFKIFALSDPRAPRGEEDRTRPLVSLFNPRLGSVQAPGSLSTIFADFSALTDRDDWQVDVAGRAAPLAWVNANQLSFQQPASLAAGEQTVTVQANHTTLWTGTETVADAAPALFVSDQADIRYRGAILNPDGGLNSVSQLARRGDTIRLYATGLSNQESLRVMIGQWDADVLAASPQGLVPGVWQLDVRVPQVDSIAKLMPVVVISAGRLSNAVTVSIAE